jgi:hypothetical protein
MPGTGSRRADPLAALEHDLRCGERQLGDVDAGAQLDVVVGVEAGVVNPDRVVAGLAAQVVLRERRSLVRAHVLLAEQHDAAVEALLAQRLRGLRSGKRRAHDHVCLACAHCPFARAAWGFLPGWR